MKDNELINSGSASEDKPVKTPDTTEEAKVDSSETSEAVKEDSSADWGDVFPDMTPTGLKESFDDLQSKHDSWKHHAKTWETRSKQNEKDVQRLRAELAAKDDGSENESLRQQLAEAQRENQVLTHLSALGGNAVELMDSVSFLAQVRELDPSDEDFADDLKALVQDRLSVTRRSGGVERVFEAREGETKRTLWDLMHGGKSN